MSENQEPEIVKAARDHVALCARRTAQENHGCDMSESRRSITTASGIHICGVSPKGISPEALAEIEAFRGRLMAMEAKRHTERDVTRTTEEA